MLLSLALFIDFSAIGAFDLAAGDYVSYLFVGEHVLGEIRSKAREIGEFIADREVQVKECESMVPLTDRTAGGVMSPLKDC